MLLHGALVGVLVYGYVQFRKPPPPMNALAIDATVVSQATLDAAQRAPVPPQPAASGESATGIGSDGARTARSSRTAGSRAG